jgi:hypothetical protein
MFKRRRFKKFGSPGEPRPRVEAKEYADMPGTRTNRFNKKLYKLTKEHSEQVKKSS